MNHLLTRKMVFYGRVDRISVYSFPIRIVRITLSSMGELIKLLTHTTFFAYYSVYKYDSFSYAYAFHEEEED